MHTVLGVGAAQRRALREHAAGHRARQGLLIHPDLDWTSLCSLSTQTLQLVTQPDKVWVDKLHNEVQSTPVTAVAVLARKEMLLGDVLSMAVGEIIPIEIVDPVTVYVDGLPVIRGKYGVKNGRYAVKVNSIQRPEEYLKAPLERGRLGPSMMRAEERGDLYERQAARAGETLEAALRADPSIATEQPNTASPS